MKSYNRPDLELLDSMEGVYAASGSVVYPTSTPVPPTPSFDYSVRFEDLDSGSYSLVRVKVRNFNSKAIKKAIFTIDFPVGDYSNSLSEVFELCGNDVAGQLCKTVAGNKITIDLFTNGQNAADNLEFWFKTKFTHSYRPSKNYNEYSGSYNGFTQENIMECQRNIVSWTSFCATK